MERVFKIKTTSNRNPRAQYPSERRYSASIVTGLSVVYFQLCLYSVLMGSLIIHKMNNANYVQTREAYSNTTNLDKPINGTSTNLFEKIEESLRTEDYYYSKIPALTCSGCFLMSVGFFCSFITGIFAWRHWYIDHNITFFFLANSLSTLTSSLSLTISLITLMNFELEGFNSISQVQIYPITLSLALNICILSFIGVIWSILASKIAYKGMKTNYPDDMNFSFGGRHVEVNTVKKGNMNINIYPPDIISHFPASDKLAKYLPKKDASNLPKSESNTEYQQRVNMFLSSEADTKSNQI